MVGLRTFTYALHTYSRGLSAAQEGPQLGSRPVRLGHVALGGWFDVRTRHRLRARRSPAASRYRVGTGCTGRAPACPHATAKQSRVASTERWSISSAQRPPATHGEQVAVRLCCVRAGRAVSGSGAWSVVAVAPSSMASTARMGLKPASHGSHHWPPEVLILQRRRWMDAAAQARGPSHGRALQLQSSPMRFLGAHTCAAPRNRSCPPSLWSAGAREGPRRAMPQVNVLSPFRANHSRNY